MNKLIKLSVCIIARNEENTIERCLQSIVNISDEIIIIHDGLCVDRTLEISKKYTNKILVAEYGGFMEIHLPLAFKESSGEWLLRIDADEFLSPLLQKSIRMLILNNNVNAYEFLWPIYDGKEYQTKNWPYKRCLFRRSKMSFLAIPHYLIKSQGKVKQVNLVLDHKPLYNNYSWIIFRKKVAKWGKIQAKLYRQKFESIQKVNYSDGEWPKNIYYRNKFPLIFLPIDFLLIFFRIIFSRAIFEGPYILRIAIFQALYRAAVDWEIYTVKKQKKS